MGRPWSLVLKAAARANKCSLVVQQLGAEGWEIEYVDVSQQPQLAQQYGVSSIPCFVAVRDGQIVDRAVGVIGRDRLIQLIQAARPMMPVQPTPPAMASNSVHNRALASTVRLKIEDANGFSFGTGTIIDVHGNEALVLTCGHVFRSSQGKGRITCDLFGENPQRDLPGKLIAFDLRRDVGLVAMQPGVPVVAAKVGGAGDQPRKGDARFSVWDATKASRQR